MIKVGLTGGIGAGKTMVANIFSKLGVPIFFADIEAKSFLLETKVKAELRSIFGDNIINVNGDIDKIELANIVFNNAEQLNKLNQIIHPKLKNKFTNWVSMMENQKYNYVIQEAAILFEANFDSEVDFTIAVFAPIEQRIKRVMRRDSVSREEVEKRINNQWPDKKIKAKANYIINNDDNNMLMKQIISIHEELMAK